MTATPEQHEAYRQKQEAGETMVQQIHRQLIQDGLAHGTPYPPSHPESVREQKFHDQCPECGEQHGTFEMLHAVFAFCETHKLRWELRRRAHPEKPPAQSVWQAEHARMKPYKLVGDVMRPSAEPERFGPHVVLSRERLPGGMVRTQTLTTSNGREHSTSAQRGQPCVFKHGLGDAVTFAYSVPLYVRRGHRVRIVCVPDQRIIFRAAGAEVVPEEDAPLINEYPFPEGIPAQMPADWLTFSKLWHSVSHPPMPDIGRDRSLWQEYCDVRIDLDPFVPQNVRESIDSFLAKLPRPLIVFHPQGRPPFNRRSLRKDVAETVYRRLLSDTPGTVIALDWAGQNGIETWTGEIPFIDHPRVISLRRDWKPLDIPEFYWLLKRADLFVGIDSGPAHFLRFTDTFGIVCWTRQIPPFGVPGYCALPRPQTMNIVPLAARPADFAYRDAYSIMESPGGELLDGDFISRQALSILKGIALCPYS